MTFRRLGIRGAALVVMAVSLLTIAGCSDAPREAAPLDVAFVVELQEGGAWSASGPAVDVGLMCTEGQTRWLRVEDLDGRPLAIHEIRAMEHEANATRVDPPIIRVNEWICADGRGAFILGERVAADTWTIHSGSGSLSGLSGIGTTSFVETLEAIQDALFMSGALTLGKQ